MTNYITILEKFKKTYGINSSLAKRMCFFINVSPLKNSLHISEFKSNLAFQHLKQLKKNTGFKLQNLEVSVFKYYHQINNIKSFKLKAALPINGQRNKTNGRTARKFGLHVRKLLASSKSSKV